MPAPTPSPLPRLPGPQKGVWSHFLRSTSTGLILCFQALKMQHWVFGQASQTLHGALLLEPPKKHLPELILGILMLSSFENVVLSLHFQAGTKIGLTYLGVFFESPNHGTRPCFSAVKTWDLSLQFWPLNVALRLHFRAPEM